MLDEMKIIPIQTPYAGRLFRSRAEARWAVALDALGLVWDYEPERYAVHVDDSGDESINSYLPDFFFPTWNCFLEVSGPEKDFLHRTKLEAFKKIADVIEVSPINRTFDETKPEGLRENIGAEVRRTGERSDKMLRSVEHLWSKAMIAGLSARFEHGQFGAMIK